MKQVRRWMLVFFVLALAIAHGSLAREDSLEIFSAPDLVNRVENLVDVLSYTRLDEIHAAQLENAELPIRPWSGWFFPLNEGGLAYRYADPNFPTGRPWEEIRNYILDTLGKGPVNDLSPAEKYDLLLGDFQFTLTKKMLQIASNHAVGGVIEGWMGYCTGWANAAMMFSRPLHSVVVLARDGQTQIEFRPSDIKALGALLWANGSFPTRLVGSLCQESPIQRDPKNDRALNPACRDSNPATWHLAVVNQIGVAHRSFVLDSDPGFQVWNQPVASYSYTYFNPMTGKSTSFEKAQVKLSEWSQDPFHEVRASEAGSVVGVEMHLNFVYEKRPDTKSEDSPDTDPIRTPIYRYDLELDQSGKVVGGEWWSRIHPDVLWVAPPGVFPKTMGDAHLQGDLSRWSIDRILPDSWVQAALVAEIYAQPLGQIVEKLFTWSKR